VSSTNTGEVGDDPPSFYRFSGYNGLKLAVSVPQDDRFDLNMFDYTITFWFRLKFNHETLEKDFTDRRMFLFDIDTFGCFIGEGLYITCTQDEENYKIRLIEFPDL
jgi:hypothetical protein